jgi:hypothetical protein
LGETELAKLAENERQLLAAQQGVGSAPLSASAITWVDAKTFAASGAGQTLAPQPATARSPAASERR